jgi:hypothetical protein
MPCQRYPLFSGTVAVSGDKKDFEKRPARRETIIPLAGQVSRKMNASGWQTAPPQALQFEVVLVTKSACPQLLEGPPGVSDPDRSNLTVPRVRSVGRVVYPPSNAHSSLHPFHILSVLRRAVPGECFV